MHSEDGIAQNIDRIAQLFPNCITEIKTSAGDIERAVDFDKLKAELSCPIADGNTQRYQFTWPDKLEASRLANAPTTSCLRPCRDESIDFDHTQNLYIEGDNLEVLKVLRHTYSGKVKMIYIDPPYNTGNDFVYEDDFACDQEEFLIRSGQKDEAGNRLVANTKSNGRFHTDWLNMMYSRLKLARELLSDDGVIFISIDDHELQNLLKVCSEIFDDKHYAGLFPWRKRTAKSDVTFGISQDYEWIVCYAKSRQFKASVEGKPRKYYETPDFPGRPWRTHDLKKQTTALERPNSFFDLIDPKNGKTYPANPNATWRISKDTLDKYMSQSRIIFPGDYDFLKNKQPVMRYWQSDDELKAGDAYGRCAVSTKLPDKVGLSEDGNDEILGLFDNVKAFSFPKPQSLISYFIEILHDKNALIMDFFSGSATTAHAVMHMNASDGGNRKFIMVQLPEELSQNSEGFNIGYRNICEIGKERIRRAGAAIKEEFGEKAVDLDIGFRVLKLDSSNMKDTYYVPAKLTMASLIDDNLKTDRTSEDLLFQSMLETDVLLSEKIEHLNIGGKEVFSVSDGFVMACFDNELDMETVKEIASKQPSYFITRNASFENDALVDNLDQIFKAYSPDCIVRII